MMLARATLALACIVSCAFAFATVPISTALADVSLDDFRLSGEAAKTDERQMFALAQARKFVKAREQAEAYLVAHPRSYVAEFTLGLVHHYGEANFPKALFHQKRALELFERQHSAEPGTDGPWRWHARILTELSGTYGDLDRYVDQIALIDRFNGSYSPQMYAERAWPLMKLRRFDEARAAARLGIASESPFQIERALNALCAIEFEAGDDTRSYGACEEAVDYARKRYGTPTAVDLGNHAEAARSVFRLDEAERLLIEATTAETSVYGNPWLELADLYMRGARFAEALSALKKVPAHRASRPAHARDSDRNESRRSLAAFYVLMGRAEDALRITERAMVLPDRRAHNSRDPLQDRAIAALLDRRARLLHAEAVVERSLALPIHRRVWARLQAAWLRVEAWMSGRRAAKYLGDPSGPDRLVGTFALGTSKSAVMPPWLLGELVGVLGHGVALAATSESDARDPRAGADAYYAALRAEAALARGDSRSVMAAGQKAVQGLSPGDALVAARVRGLMAMAAPDQSQRLGLLERVLQTDPGLFRRMGWRLPITVHHGSDGFDALIAKALARSPRFEVRQTGFQVQVNEGRACLLGPSGTAWGCGSDKEAGSAVGDNDQEDRNPPTTGERAQRVVDAFHEQVFAPRIDLSRTDVNSLDGSNTTTRAPLGELLD